MAWIEMIDEEHAEGELAPLYERTADPAYGRVDHIMQIHSLHPAGLRAHDELYRTVMRGLRRLLRDDDLADGSRPATGRRAWTTSRRCTASGFADADILAIAEVVAYYAYVNRIADGLGVKTESWIP